MYKYIEKLRLDQNCDYFFRGFLDMVKGKMLVVESEWDVRRKSAANVAANIVQLREKAGILLEEGADDILQEEDEILQEGNVEVREGDDYPKPGLTYAKSNFSGASSDTTMSTNPHYAESIFSVDLTGPSASSRLSFNSVVAVRDEVVNLIIADQQIQVLVEAALNDRRIGDQRLERNFRRLLDIYSKDLMSQTPSPMLKKAATIVRNQSSQIAYAVKSFSQRSSQPLLPQLTDADDYSESSDKRIRDYFKSLHLSSVFPEKEAFYSQLPKDEDILDNNDSSDTGADTSEIKSISATFDEVKEFLGYGSPMANFKARLQSFVSPDFEKEEGLAPFHSRATSVMSEGNENGSIINEPGDVGAVAAGNITETEETGMVEVRDTSEPSADIEDAGVSHGPGLKSYHHPRQAFRERPRGEGQYSLVPEPALQDGFEGPESFTDLKDFFQNLQRKEKSPEGSLGIEAITMRPETYPHPATLPQMLDLIFEKIGGFCSEPPIPQGQSRIRWTCVSWMY